MSRYTIGADNRMRSAHPASERDQVIRRGRVFGGLQPTRAFGDAVYKWNLEQGNAYVSISLFTISLVS